MTTEPGPRRPRRSPRQVHEDVDEELRLHLELRAAELERAGMDPGAARDEARRRFGALDETRRECVASDRRRERTVARRAYLEDLFQDLAHGVRQLRSRPRLAIPVILTLAGGIGAATAIFGAADHVLLRPLPYPEPARVVTLWEADRASAEPRRQVAPGNMLDWKQRTTSFVAMGLAEPSGVNLTRHRPPVPVRTWDVSSGFLEALGVRPAAGRLFSDAEYAGDHRVVLISHDYWRRAYASDPSIAGTPIELEQQTFTIVGVLPRGMEYPEPKDIWVPKRFRQDEIEERRSGYMDAVARIRPGITLEQARADLDRVARQLAVEYPRTNASVGIEAVPIADQVLGRARTALLALLGAVGLLLLIACANVASLVLSRGIEREREFAVRSALGAPRSRLVRQLMTESLLLAGIGGVLGVAVAWWGTRALVALGPSWLPRASSIGIDGRVLAGAAAITVASAVLFGLFPAMQFSRARGEALTADGRTTHGRRGVRLRRAIVAGELALALVLLTGAGLLIRSFVELLANPLGFATENRVALQLFLWDRNPSADERRNRVHEITEAFRAIPGVTDVAVVTALPFHPSQIDAQGDMSIVGRTSDPAGDAQVYTTIASPEYFRVMAIPLVVGRGFTRDDRAGAPRVAIVSRTLAARHFRGEDPIGKRVNVGVMAAPQEWEIVGIVDDVRPTGHESAPRAELYVPFEQTANGGLTFVAHATSGPQALLHAMQARIAAIDPLQTIYHSNTVAELVDRTLVERRFYLGLMIAFSSIALALAGIGVYGLMTMSTTHRNREIGVRLALGAKPADIVGMLLRDGMRMIGTGLLLGIVGSLLLAPVLHAMLYRVQVADPPTLVLGSTTLFLTAVVAALVPALRSGRIDPMVVLRHE